MPVPVSVSDSFRARPAEGVEALPVQIPHNPSGAERRQHVDCVEPVDRQLTQELQVSVLAAQALEQERGILDGQLGPAVDIGGAAGVRVVSVGELLGHPCRIGTGRDP